MMGIKKGMEKLPPKCRLVFSLSRFSEMSNKEIARELEVSEKTIRNHTSNLFAKLQLENRQHAIRDFGGLF